MDLKSLKPLHGWRVFLGEVGVVVLGVLLALGAQQIVQAFEERSDERAFRQTIDHEIGLNLFVYEVRARQFECTTKKIAELRAWLDKARTGVAVPAIHAGAPATITPYRSAWDNRDANVFNRLPPRIRQKYAEFYDEVANNWQLVQQEQQDWKRLWPYAEPGPISFEDRRTIRPILATIGGFNDVLEANLPLSEKIAQELKIKEAQPDNFPPEFLKQLEGCRSVIAAREKIAAPAHG